MQLQGLKLQCPTVQKEMQSQVNTLFDLWVNFTQTVAKFSLHHVTYVLAKFQGATPTDLGGVGPLTLGSTSHERLPSTLYIFVAYQSLNMFLKGYPLEAKTAPKN